MEFRKKGRDVVSMDITPLVDVVFLLLIFFMLSTTFVVAPGIRINLPEAKAESIRKEGSEVRIKLNAEGKIYVDELEVSAEALEARLAQAAAGDRDTLVIIEADEQSMHRFVVEVMDSAKTAGLNRMAIATRPSR
jgi:biopolymer transport protein ExbD